MTRRINDTFQSFWYGSLSSREQFCLASFVKRGKEVDLYTYDESLSVPEGVSLKDASEIYPEEEVFTHREGPCKGHVAPFSDLFRYKLLYQRGGWWVDTDVIYTGHAVPTEEEYFGLQHESEANTAVLRLPKGSRVAKECMRRVNAMRKKKQHRLGGKRLPNS